MVSFRKKLQKSQPLEFPTLPKKLLKALGFERVDAKTYVGVLPVFINLGEKEQEIELELGVNLPEMRKKIIDIVKTPARLISVAEEKKTAQTIAAKKKAPAKEASTVAKKTTATKKAASTQKKAATKAAPEAKKTAAKKTTKTSTTKKTTTKKTATKATATKARAAKTKRAKKG